MRVRRALVGILLGLLLSTMVVACAPARIGLEPSLRELLYKARIRLLDTEAGTVLWQGVCELNGADDPAQSPTLDEIEAADGVVYRRMIDEATAACVKELRRQYRGEAT
jgi:hypothetical protein